MDTFIEESKDWVDSHRDTVQGRYARWPSLLGWRPLLATRSYYSSLLVMLFVNPFSRFVEVTHVASHKLFALEPVRKRSNDAWLTGEDDSNRSG